MQDNNGQTRQHRFSSGKEFGHRRGSSPPFRELEGGFDDWVRELRTILQTQENPLTIPCSRKKASQKTDLKSVAEPQSDEGTPFNVKEECLEEHR